ncbi:MAG: hypothetical protein HY042_02800, partial [Spirochaetia bacterium]|nr:hypothetical protein [Spirochaetia bacterium]
MATRDQETVESALEVLELTQASELCQAMEARGDFKFKGIFAVFNTILEWTQRFSSNGILPTEEQLARDAGVPADRLHDYLVELVGRGQSRAKLIAYLPDLDYIAGPNPGLHKMTVFCRPSKTEATSTARYVQALVDKGHKVIAKWIETRKTYSGEEMTDTLVARIEEGKLQDTQAGAEVARLFYTDFDNTPEMRKIAYTLHAKPVIQRLLASKHLLLLQQEADRAIYYNSREELELRFAVLSRYFLNRMAGKPGSGDVDTATIRKLVAGFSMDSASAGQKQLLRELKVLPPIIDKLSNDEKESRKKADLDKVIQEVAKSPHVMELERIRGMGDEIRTAILSSGSLLRTEYAVNGRLSMFVLHRDAIIPAVKSARELFDTKSDPLEVRILSSMGVERYLPHDHLKAFQDLEQRTLFPRLPFFVRLWRYLFGSSKLKPDEVAKLKQSIERESTEDRLRIQRAEAEKAKKKLASERMKEKEEPVKRPEPSHEFEPPEKAEGLEERTIDDLQAEETVRSMISELDKAWDEKMLPNRVFLASKFPQFDEDSLIMFLKKHGRKEILSFRIHHDKPEYVWPILITRRYIRAKG